MSHLFSTYNRWEIVPEYAEGAYIFEANGKQYLDFTSGIGVCNLGHRPPQVEEAVTKQLNKFWHLSNLFPQPSQEKAAKLLAETSGLDLVFFTNSGAEAVEGALKLARKATNRSKVIAFTQSFHGRTFGAMSATGQEKIKIGFGPMLNTFVHVPYNDSEALLKEIDEDTAAILLEVILGEGGIIPADPDFLKTISTVCKQKGILLIIDEIQTGIGRTGKPFAFQHYHIEPDIITVAKGLGSGLPIGAVVGKATLGDSFGAGSHGSTFGGNPLSIAAAISTLETVFTPSFLDNVAATGKYLYDRAQQALGSISGISEVRGKGLMIGIEMTGHIHDALFTMRKNGLLALPASTNVIRLLPPLIIGKEEVDIAINIMKESLS